MSMVLTADGHVGDAAPICQSCLFEVDGQKVDVPMEELSPGPAPRRKALKKNKQISVAQERDIQEEFGARMQPGSGNQPGKKGDNRRKGSLRIEGKVTRANSFRLELEVLEKIAGEATFGEMPVLVIDFVQPGTSKLRDRFTVINAEDFKSLNQLREEHASSKHRRPERST
jgi:hypothetical protein